MFIRRRKDAKCDPLRVFNAAPLSLFQRTRSFKDVVSRERKWRGKRSPILPYWRWKVGFCSRQGLTLSRLCHSKKKKVSTVCGSVRMPRMSCARKLPILFTISLGVLVCPDPLTAGRFSVQFCRGFAQLRLHWPLLQLVWYYKAKDRRTHLSVRNTANIWSVCILTILCISSSYGSGLHLSTQLSCKLWNIILCHYCFESVE